MTTLKDYIDLGERYNNRFDRPDDCLCDEELDKGAVCSYCLEAGFGTPNEEGDQ
jgi:hypothetical protein